MIYHVNEGFFDGIRNKISTFKDNFNREYGEAKEKLKRGESASELLKDSARKVIDAAKSRLYGNRMSNSGNNNSSNGETTVLTTADGTRYTRLPNGDTKVYEPGGSVRLYKQDPNSYNQQVITTKQGGNTIPPRVNSTQNSNPTVSGTSNSGKNNSPQGTLTLDTPEAKYYRMPDGSTKVIRGERETIYGPVGPDYKQNVTTTKQGGNTIPPRVNTSPNSNQTVSRISYTPLGNGKYQETQTTYRPKPSGFFGNLGNLFGRGLKNIGRRIGFGESVYIDNYKDHLW